MRLPTITLTIAPLDNPHVEIKANWKSPDGKDRTIRQVVTLAVMDDFLGDIVYEIFDTIKETEDKFYG